MKYTLFILALMLSFASQAATTPWPNYPTTNTFGDTDTFMIGNGATNLTIVGSGVKGIMQTIANTTSNSLNTSINTSSNAVFGNAQTAINTSSNAVLGNAQTAINTSSNSVLANAQTAINTTSNSLNTSINTSSNLVYGNALTQINTTSNSVIGTAQTIANSTSNSIYNLTGTNLVMFTNGPPTAGQAVVIVGTNTYGAVMVKGTNVWSSGGGGSQTPIAQDVNWAQFSATNMASLQVGAVTNTSLTASTLLKADANKKVVSIPNAAGVITNDGSGNFGSAPLLTVTSLGSVPGPAAFDVNSNLYPVNVYTNFGSATNLTLIFDGFPHRGTVTNGATVFLNWSGSNGSWSLDIQTNVSVWSSTIFAKFLANSNGVSSGVYKVTNAIFSVSSYGGTNTTQLKPAINEY